MVRKKRISKRVTLKDKYKIKRKVAEHHKKLKKEAKKNPAARKRLKKDLGVPNLWPMKQDLLNRLQQDRRETFENAKNVQEEKKRKRTDTEQMNDMTDSANKRTRQFDEAEELQIQEDTSQVLKDSSKKTFFREFKKVIKAADVILEVLDARDPLGSRSRTIERQIMELDPNKKIILILNKIDLIPKENVANWLSFLRDEYPTIAFKSSTQKQNKNLGRSKVLATKMTDSAETCLGADVLIQLLKNYSRSQDIKQSISVGIIGFPNVGKSSLINSLKRTKAVMVGARPGVTRSITEISLDKNITLLDCPGIIFATDMSESDAALRNCINFDQLEDPILPVQAILTRCPRDKILQIYKIPMFTTPLEFLQHVATKRGKFLQGGVLNIDAAARDVLHDWNSGKIPYYTVPPVSDFAQNRLGASIVTQWSEAFKLSDIMELEKATVITALPQNDDVFTFASAVLSEPITPHDAFTKLDCDEDMVLAGIPDDEPPKQVKRNKKTGELTIAPIKEKKEKTASKKKNKSLRANTIQEKKIKKNTTDIIPESENKEYDFSADFWTTPLPTVSQTTNNEDEELKDVSAFTF